MGIEEDACVFEEHEPVSCTESVGMAIGGEIVNCEGENEFPEITEYLSDAVDEDYRKATIMTMAE